MNDRIKTQHPQGKQGVNIEKSKHEQVKAAILGALQGKELTHTDLTNEVSELLKDSFDGSIGWYTETVKLDLEAHHLIERDTSLSPARYRISSVA
ncbi:DUF6958 family protein [Tunicatimonas pelagia]|uniref:DUF6958 family protein n=1 Tax=Tunicatimonas pelagia TaxID=931531 RepID=UPI002666328A|nr:hypothetical protein [Tunicatimonas pelagia]WKN45834.1 hypothetical protein P0M28_12780 [Tunicatimonas pelagia]